MNYLTINIKRLFLSFVQQYFATQTKYKWTQDPRTTKVYVADKYSFDPSVIEKLPSIVLSRGTMQWENIAIDQRLTKHLNTGSTSRTDLVRGSLTFSCIAKNGLEAEQLADTLFYLFVGYKDQFKEKGVFSIKPVIMGEEQMIRADSSPRSFMVPVQVGYELQQTVNYGMDAYGGATISSNSEDTYLQFIDFEFTSASGILFYTAPPSGVALSMTYVDAVTLLDSSQPPVGIVDGINKVFTLSSAVYGIYPLLEHITYTTTVSGLY